MQDLIAAVRELQAAQKQYDDANAALSAICLASYKPSGWETPEVESTYRAAENTCGHAARRLNVAREKMIDAALALPA